MAEREEARPDAGSAVAQIYRFARIVEPQTRRVLARDPISFADPTRVFRDERSSQARACIFAAHCAYVTVCPEHHQPCHGIKKRVAPLGSRGHDDLSHAGSAAGGAEYS